MKRNIIIILVSVLILTCLFVFARTTTTDLGLVKPTWGEEEDILDDLNANSDILEAFANDPLEYDSDLERLEDRAGAMWTGNTETGLTITYQDADNTIDAVIGADDIVETMLKFVNLPADEDIFTYESTTGDFEWHTLAELSIQPLDAGLTSIAGLSTEADKMIYTTASDVYATVTLTAFARTIIDDAAATNVRDTLGLTIGTNVEAHDDGLLSIAGLTTAANKSIYTTALDVYAVYDLTAAGRAILDDADASAQRTTLGLVIGTNVQASDASLTSIAGLTYASDSFIKVTAEDVYAIRTITETKTDLSLNNVSNVATDDTAYNATSWDANSDAATKNAVRDKFESLSGGYTNLTSFVDQTAWRVFYSNTDGDVVELALGADGTYLKSNGAAAAPTFVTPAGAGDVVKVGTPANSQVGVWTGDGTIEGAASLTYDGSNLQLTGDIGATGSRITKGWFANLETTGDLTVNGTALASTYATLGANTNITSILNAGLYVGRDADNTINFATDNHIIFKTNGATGMEVDSTGELDMNANTIGFTQQSTTGDGTTTIDWKLGNKFKFTFGAQNDTFTFTAPTNPCNILLVLIQDGTGSRLATWPGTVKWAGGTAPTLTTGAGTIDICSFYWDGTNYFGVASLAFAVP